MKKIFLILSLPFLVMCTNSDHKSEQKNDSNNVISIEQSYLSKYIVHERNNETQFLQSYNALLDKWSVPFTELDIPTSFGTAHVIVTGWQNKKSIVLLHGMNATCSMWYPNIEALSTKYRVFSIDFIVEPGKSRMTKKLESETDIIHWYGEIFTKLELKQFSLVGASRGGWIAVNLALSKEFSIDKLALLSPAQTFKWISPGIGMVKNIAFTLNPKEENVDSVLRTMSQEVDKIDPLFKTQFLLATKEAGLNASIIQMRPFSDDQIQNLKMPILLLIGDQDMINSSKSIERAEENIRNIRTHVIQGAGHFLSIDKPEIVNQRLIEFLAD